MSRRAAVPLLAALLALALAGCGLIMAPRTIAPRFFILNAVAPHTGATAPIVIGLGPLSLPSYLDRPEMARRVDANQIVYDPEARWAESLRTNFQRALGANLVQLMGPERIVTFPWYSTEKLDFSVSVAATRFEQQADGSLELSGRWVVRDRHDATVAARIFDYTRPGGTPDANAAALSELIAELSEAIAAAMQSAPAAAP
ncbi:membrane integrity-associated transporter subunit PqiC [bacterium]|nr:membrane integrity-associated transporter subunit PqiC [bacterium]